MAKILLGKVGITNEGYWKGEKAFPNLALVSYEGQAYISLRENLDVVPGTDKTTWMLISERGESLYQLMVRKHLFEGTEDEFAQQYADIIAEMHRLNEASVQQMAAVDDAMAQIARAEEQRVLNEQHREQAATEQAAASNQQALKDAERDKAERARENDYQLYKVSLDATVQLANQAVENTIAATTAANEATQKSEDQTALATQATDAAKAATEEAKSVAARTTALEQNKLDKSAFAQTLTEGGAITSIQDTDTVVIIRGEHRYSCTAAALRDYINYGIQVEFLN